MRVTFRIQLISYILDCGSHSWHRFVRVECKLASSFDATDPILHVMFVFCLKNNDSVKRRSMLNSLDNVKARCDVEIEP